MAFELTADVRLKTATDDYIMQIFFTYAHLARTGITATLLVGALVTSSFAHAAEVLRLNLDETNGTVAADSSGTGNNGTVLGNPERINGISGLALNLDGADDRVSVTDNATLDLSNAFTLALWIQPDHFGTQRLLHKGSRADNGYELSLSNSQRRVFVRLNRASNNNSFRLLSNDLYPIDGTWLHVAATFDGNTITMYFNGQPQSTLNASGLVIGNNALPLSIGADNNGAQPFTGGIDQIHVFDTALSAAEVQNLFNTEQGGGGIQDADNDGMPDDFENQFGLDPNNAADANQDPDNDGLTNLQEFNNGSNPVDAPPADGDNDGMPDDWEQFHNLNPADGTDAAEDPDNDKVTNLQEFNQRSLPGDGPPAPDSDNDGIPNDWETLHGLNPASAADANQDPDGDKISNVDEFGQNTVPVDGPPAPDTDNDGMPNDWEVFFQFNPQSNADAALDADNDGSTNLQEFQAGTNPRQNDGGNGGGNNDELLTLELDEAGGGQIIDSSGNGNNGSIIGNVNSVGGINNNAQQFDGGRILIPDADQLDISNPVTIALWARPDRAGTQKILSKSRSNINGYEISLSSSGRAFVRFNQATEGNGFRLNSSSQFPRDGQTWFHIAATYDGATIRLYFDGQQQASLNAPGLVIGANDLPLALGARDDGSSSYSGSIDQVHIIPQALSAVELQTLIDNEQGGVSDSDNDGMPDDFETANGFDPNDPADASQDADGDNISNLDEFNQNTNPVAGPPAPDADNDGMADDWETFFGLNPANQADGALDADGDKISNLDEFNQNSNPSNGPPAPDADADGMPDDWEIFFGLNPAGNGDAGTDLDGDQISNLDEFNQGTNPTAGPPAQDLDNDGMADDWETFFNLNPANAADASDDPDNDGFTNLQEFQNGTDPQTANGNNGGNGEVLDLPFDENSGNTAFDQSGFNNNGTLQGGPLRIAGIRNNALRFDGGNDRVLVADSPTLALANQFTISTWVKAETSGTQYVIKKARQNVVDGYELGISSNGAWFVRFNQASNANNQRILATSQIPTDGTTWVHLAVTYDGAAIRLFSNGQIDTAANLPGLFVAANSLSLSIGAQDDGVSPFTGGIDQVHLFDTALSVNQVQELFQSELGTLDSDNDGMSDDFENQFGLDPNDPNDANGDPDQDRISNLDEFNQGSNPTDGPPPTDTDNDGMADDWEQFFGLNPASAADAASDNDGDKISNLNEFIQASNPVAGPPAPDADNDGMPDDWELFFGLNPADAADAAQDADGDKISSLDEFNQGTSPTTGPPATDTDNDGMPDDWELFFQLNPADDSDANANPDNDGATNLQEFQAGTNPRQNDGGGGGGNLQALELNLDEGGGTSTADSSGNNNNGVLNGNVERVPGISGNAVRFSGGDNRVVVADDDSLNLGNTFTLAFWLRPDVGGSVNLLSKKRRGGVDGYEISLSSSGVVFARFNQASQSNNLRVNGTTQIEADGQTWTHIATSYDGTDLRIYVNGSQEGVLNAPGLQVNDNDVDLALGAQDDGNKPYSGSIDQVHIFNEALSPGDLQTLIATESNIALDSDNDGMSDDFENQFGLNPNDPSDANADPDGDQVSNLDESLQNTNPIDGPPAPDTDNDGMPDDWELRFGLNPAVADANDDPDGDKVNNGNEFVLNTNPTAGPPAADQDNDGMPDDWELLFNLDATDPTDAGDDDDGDKISNLNEFTQDTDPSAGPPAPDADNDGMPDDWEQFFGFNPLNGADANEDADNDGSTNLQEFQDGTNPQDSLGDNEVLLLALDESSGTVAFDSSGFNNNGNYQGNPQQVQGVSGNALEFANTNDLLLVPHDPSLNTVNAMTIAAWLRPNQIGTQHALKKALTGASDGWELSLSASGKVFGRLNQASSSNAFRIDSQSQYPSDGQTWVHVAATYDGNNFNLFMNGVLERSLNVGAIDIGPNELPISVGAESNGQRPYNGAVDQIHLLPRAMTQAEIQSLINAETQGDSDSDGMSDDFENTHGLNPFDASDASEDPDGDKITNLQEFGQGSNPVAGPPPPDTDNDGMPDDWEVFHGFSRLNPDDADEDSDSDGSTNLQEFQAGTNPRENNGGGGGGSGATEELDAAVSTTTTGEKPQSKVWQFAQTWWAVFPDSQGTFLRRLDGTSWTSVLQLTNNSFIQADYELINNGSVVHILLFDDDDTELFSVEFVPGTPGTYQPWGQRPTPSAVPLPNTVETATTVVDSTDRLWVCYDDLTRIRVQWSEAPYNTFSGPFTIASGVSADDICAISRVGSDQVGVFWSDQNDELFGFRVHNDGDSPTNWGIDEQPGITEPTGVGGGLADDHINLANRADGTVFATVKTSFDSGGFPVLGVFRRDPVSGWGPLNEVDMIGTRSIVVYDAPSNQLMVVYPDAAGSTGPAGQNVFYRLSDADNIMFGARQLLLNGNALNNPSSTIQVVNGEVVFIISTSNGAQTHGIRFVFD